MPQLGFFLLDHRLHFCFQLVSFELLEQVCLHLDLLRLFVSLHPHQLGLLVSELEQVLGEFHLGLEFPPNFVLELLELEHVLLLQLFERQVRRRLVVAHVVVPRLRELEELGFLGSLDVVELLLLSSSDVVSLALGLLLEQFVELRT